MGMIRNTILSLMLIGFAAAVSACVIKPTSPPVNQNQNTNTVTSTVEIDISNWKTYQNEEFGFEFKYPSNFKLSEDERKAEWFKVTIKGAGFLTVSNAPIGFESAEPFDLIVIGGRTYNRSVNRSAGYTQHIIVLDDGFYIFYGFTNTNQLDTLEAIVRGFRRFSLKNSN